MSVALSYFGGEVADKEIEDFKDVLPFLVRQLELTRAEKEKEKQRSDVVQLFKEFADESLGRTPNKGVDDALVDPTVLFAFCFSRPTFEVRAGGDGHLEWWCELCDTVHADPWKKMYLTRWAYLNRANFTRHFETHVEYTFRSS